jgi:tRNA nucleotidyltransferase (CCA-adding enzyme)
MSSSLERVCATVLKRVTPNPKARKDVLALAEELGQKVMTTAKEANVDAEVRVEGSVAKDTWLSEEPDIDIFMRVPTTMPRKAFGTTCLDIARKATEGFEQIERFAEHPYLESVVDRIRVNIVPCYKVEKGEWISATDRTPFHTDYVKPLLDQKKRGEIRLLKKFMKGISVYGAEIKVGGFSGYLCELLILNYKSFVSVLRSAADWKERRIIDFEGYYEEREIEAERIFEEPLVMVDPVDKGRNAAAAVRKERFDELIAAARAFLKRPDLDFFYPKPTETLKPEKLTSVLKSRGSTLVFLKLGKIEAVPDILWGQLYKSQRSLRKMLRQNDFGAIRGGVWSDEENLNMFIFEVEHPALPLIKKHFGPPLRKRVECEKFLRKHPEGAHTISGPRVEGGRWVVEMKRKHTDVVSLFLEELKDGGRRVGVAGRISQAVAKNLEVLVGEEVLELYSSNPEFARFLTGYLKGKPKWLK